LDPPHELSEFFQVRSVRRCRSTNAERNAVLDHRVALQNAIEMVAGFATVDHEVFADNLEKIDVRACVQNVSIVRDT
jgi:hypothetical protein